MPVPSESPLIALACTNVGHAYGGRDERALDGVSLEVAEGGFCGLLGPNGAGKTTLIHVVCGVLRPTSGEVRLFGRSPRDPWVRRLLGFCPQELAVYAPLTGRENLRLFAVLAGIPPGHRTDRIARALEIVGLTSHADRAVDVYSGGMKRRLNLAVALLHEPRLLLLDEPTVGVDAQSRNLIFESLLELNRAGTTLIYATHYMEEAERLCSDVFIIDHGTLLAHGTPAELTRGSRAARVAVELDGGGASALAAALGARGIEAFVQTPERLEIAVSRPADLFPELIGLAREAGREIVRYEAHPATLEDRFLELTGRHLRD